MMTWERRAATLADEVTHRRSRWRGPVAQTPRHLLVPKWWDSRDQDWTLADGQASEEDWMRAAYSDTTLVTEVGGLHADHAMPSDHPDGPATSTTCAATGSATATSSSMAQQRSSSTTGPSVSAVESGAARSRPTASQAPAWA